MSRHQRWHSSRSRRIFMYIMFTRSQVAFDQKRSDALRK